MVDALARKLVWLGVEDHTGLWEAALEARDGDSESPLETRERVRRTIESLVAEGIIELFVCQEPWDNETVEIVSSEERAELLDQEASWTVPETGGRSVRFATTDRGFGVYKSETGWIER